MAAKLIEKFMPAPVKGLNFTQLMTNDVGEYCLGLQNFLCRPEGLIVPKGHTRRTGNPASTKVIFSYREQEIFVVSANIYAENTGGALIAVNSATGHSVEISTAANDYVLYFDETAPKIYDGAAWAATAWVGAPATGLFQGIVHRGRLYALERNTQSLWYLPPGAVAGALTEYSAGTVFRKGGFIVAGNSLSVDGGSGPDDYLALLSSSGEVAVFSGNDPAAADWRPVGVFDVGLPVCGVDPQPRVMVKSGGDLWIFTKNGVKSLATIMRGDPEAVNKSLSAAIDPFVTANLTTSSYNQLAIINSQNLLLMTFVSGVVPRGVTMAMDTRTGGWSTLEDVTDATVAGAAFRAWWIEVAGGASAGVWAGSALGADVPVKAFSSSSLISQTAFVQYPFCKFGSLEDKIVLSTKPYWYIGGAARPTELGTQHAVTIGCDLDGVGQADTMVFSQKVAGSMWNQASEYFGDYNGSDAQMFAKWLNGVSHEQGSALGVKFSLSTESSCTHMSFLGADIRIQPVPFGNG